MAGLFDFDEKAEGYRLDKFEFYNWVPLTTGSGLLNPRVVPLF